MNYLINFSLKIYLISLLLFSYNAYSKSNDLSVVPDLKNVEIISVSKEKESVFKAASSVYVLSSLEM